MATLISVFGNMLIYLFFFILQCKIKKDKMAKNLKMFAEKGGLWLTAKSKLERGIWPWTEGLYLYSILECFKSVASLPSH